MQYIFDYEYCNKGYCTEACEKIIDISFDKLHLASICAETVENNKSSQRVLQKLSFDYQSSELKI